MIIYTIERLRWIKRGEKIVYYRGPVELTGPQEYRDIIIDVHACALQMKINERVRLVQEDIPSIRGHVEYSAVGLCGDLPRYSAVGI